MPNSIKLFVLPIALMTLHVARMLDGETELPYRTDVTSPRLELLKKQVEEGQTDAVRKFWEEMKAGQTPLVETISGDPKHVLVTFVSQAPPATRSLVLYSQLTSNRDLSLNVLTHLLGTDVWYKTYWIHNDMRVSYSFLPDPTPESLSNPRSAPKDPLNPNPFRLVPAIWASLPWNCRGPRLSRGSFPCQASLRDNSRNIRLQAKS